MRLTPLRVRTAALDREEPALLNACWQACKDLAAGMICLRHDPVPRVPREPKQIEKPPLGHRGASPDLAFMYGHADRLIRNRDVNTAF